MAGPMQSKINVFLLRSCCQDYLLKAFPEEAQHGEVQMQDILHLRPTA